MQRGPARGVPSIRVDLPRKQFLQLVGGAHGLGFQEEASSFREKRMLDDEIANFREKGWRTFLMSPSRAASRISRSANCVGQAAYRWPVSATVTREHCFEQARGLIRNKLCAAILATSHPASPINLNHNTSYPCTARPTGHPKGTSSSPRVDPRHHIPHSLKLRGPGRLRKGRRARIAARARSDHLLPASSLLRTKPPKPKVMSLNFERRQI